MKRLVEHLVRHHLPRIAASSLMHCHARNVHSILLDDKVRIFIAEPGHDLDGNHPNFIKQRQSVGFHGHHCDLTLAPTRGMIYNFGASLTPPPRLGSQFDVDAFDYQSAITGGKVGFERVGPTVVYPTGFTPVCEGQTLHLDARELHTIYADPQDWAAWLVFEGREVAERDTRCYSFSRPDLQDFSEFYKPMSEDGVRFYLMKARLL